MSEFILPSGFTKKMKNLLGAQWASFENCYKNDRYQGLRFNPLKKNLSENDYSNLLHDLSITDTEQIPWAEHGFYYGENAHPGKHPYHEAGLYYIQEPSAMSAATLLAPSPGERVLDLCAAPGGKSTQLASYMNQEGLLISNEIHPSRCKILSQNIERLGISNTIVTNENSDVLAAHFPEYFHKILVDAPCSGEGMFRKNPEAALEWSLDQVQICADRQLSILENAAAMLMPGGTIVYSTCTFSPEENEGVIGQFLDHHPEFTVTPKTIPYFDAGNPDWGNGSDELKYTFRLWPHHLHGEGHFAAILQKNGTPEDLESKIRKKKPDKKLFSILQEFTSNCLSKDMENYILSGNLVLFGDQLYRLPDQAPDLSGIRVLRAGLHIGTFKKNRFEPAHALALYSGKEDVQNYISLTLSDPRSGMFFAGESFQVNAKKGWCLVCINGYSAGWGKVSGDDLKNHYPKGLRKEYFSII